MAALNTLASEGDGGDASESDATAALSIQALGVIGIATEPAAEEMTKQGNEAIVDGKRQSDGSPRSAPWVEETAASLFAVIPHGGDKAGDRVEEVEGNEVVTVEEDVSKEGNVFENLIQDLEALTPVANNVAALEGIKLTEPTTEVFHTNGVGAWENGRGMKQVGDTGGEGAIIISPSRFSPLQGIVEEEEDAMEENGKEVEEGEILETNVDGKKVPGVQT
ncbi:hypothetical protein YC2023_088838 [Brassica napus]